jgi:DCC1-like thiol-disulfide oxidoreductase
LYIKIIDKIYNEIGGWRPGQNRGPRKASDLLCFVAASESAASAPEGITRQRATERFHVRAIDGRVLSGPAFVEVLSRLPKWRWAARVASLPSVLAVLELGYKLLFGTAMNRRPIQAYQQAEELKADGANESNSSATHCH